MLTPQSAWSDRKQSREQNVWNFWRWREARIGSVIIFHLSGLWKAKSSYCGRYYFWWGCRRTLTLITLGSERVKHCGLVCRDVSGKLCQMQRACLPDYVLASYPTVETIIEWARISLQCLSLWHSCVTPAWATPVGKLGNLIRSTSLRLFCYSLVPFLPLPHSSRFMTTFFPDSSNDLLTEFRDSSSPMERDSVISCAVVRILAQNSQKTCSE